MTTTHLAQIAEPVDRRPTWPRTGARAGRRAGVLVVRATGRDADLALFCCAGLLVASPVAVGLASANPWPAGVVAILLAALAVRDRRVRLRLEGDLATRALERDRLHHELERMGEELRWTREASSAVAEGTLAPRTSRTSQASARITSGGATATPTFDAACLAHEVSGPLTGILARAELALEDLPATSPLRGILEPIRADALRAAAIMTGMLRRDRRAGAAPTQESNPSASGVSGHGASGHGAPVDRAPVNRATSVDRASVDRASVDLPALADQLVERLGPCAARAGVRLAAAVSPGPGPCVLSRRERLVDLARADLSAWPIRCDSITVTQIVENLIANAVAACPGGGTVHVETWLAPDAAEIRVIDDGIGMDLATLAQAFEPGFTTRAGAGGHGLGLGISRRLAEACGGSLTGTSHAGRGTVMLLRLPLSGDARLSVQAAGSAGSLRSAA